MKQHETAVIENWVDSTFIWQNRHGYLLEGQSSATPSMGLYKRRYARTRIRNELEIPRSFEDKPYIHSSKHYLWWCLNRLSHDIWVGILSLDPRSDQGLTRFLYGPNSDSFTMETSLENSMRRWGRARIYRTQPELRHIPSAYQNDVSIRVDGVELQFQNHMREVKDGSQSMSARYTTSKLTNQLSRFSHSHVSVWTLVKEPQGENRTDILSGRDLIEHLILVDLRWWVNQRLFCGTLQWLVVPVSAEDLRDNFIVSSHGQTRIYHLILTY